MAKNKNRKPASQNERSAQTERAEQQSGASQTEAQSTTRVPGSPSDVARKHEKRFGHN
ncbi:hypothetical protein [Streptomyces sp. NPDC058045]|uniref:hypothetical protein n=1 Tax=Streptomyces sp. NPDC058045 TaxID=3346311 RepID=UPI0036E57CC7